MIRVVLDTNILISGFLYPGGAPSRIVSLASEGTLHNSVSPYILGEFRRILTSKLKRSRRETEGHIDIIIGFSEVFDAISLRSKIELDANDVPILACAIAAQASFIVTGDRKMLAAGRYERVRFISAADALQLTA